MLTQTELSPTTDVTFAITDTYPTQTPLGSGLGTFGGPNAHILVTGASSELLGGERPDPTQIAGLIGRIVPVRPARGGRNAWFYENHDFLNNGAYLTGPTLNPAPVNGGHYRELMPTNGADRAPFVIRYNDDDHLDSRTVRNNPWTLVHTNSVSLHREVARIEVPRLYVEVTWPAPAPGATDEEIDLILADEEAPPARTIENSTTNNTMGRAKVGEDGLVVLNPPLVPGVAYIAWDTADLGFRRISIVGYAETRHRETIQPVGYLSRNRDDSLPGTFTNDLYTNMINTSRGGAPQWVELGSLPHTENEDAESERVAEILALRRTEFNDFESLNDALNDLAEEQSWCGEYEETMSRIGMRSRRSSTPLTFQPGTPIQTVSNRHAYDIEVEVDFTRQTDYINSTIESALESSSNFNGSVSSITFSARTTMTINGVVADDDQSARDSIDLSQVENAMDEAGVEYDDIDDWNIEDVTEDDDFDWDNYEEE